MCPACFARHTTAGPDVIRGSSPNQMSAVEPLPFATGSHDPRRRRSIITSSSAPCNSRVRLRLADLSRYSCGRTMIVVGPVVLFMNQQRPGGARHFVGERDSDEPRWLAIQESTDPTASNCLRSGVSRHRGCSDHQQATHVPIPLTRDAAEPFLPTARVLFGHETKPCRELPARAKMSGIEHCGGDRGGNDRADARNGGQASAHVIGLMPGADFRFDLRDGVLDVVEL